MKTLILSLLLPCSVSFAFAQLNDPNYPCPIEIKSNQGGGDCPEFNGQQGTAVVTLVFAAPLTCVPKLIAVTDHNDDTRFLQSGVGTIKQAPNNNVVEYCLYGDNDENFFNQPDLIATLEYTCPDPSNPALTTTVRIRCNEAGEEIPLPVLFSSFNASRQNATVAITWTTATEISNKGFYVQRNVNGVWTNIAFVFSQADGGNSSSALTYEYRDINNESGISQYRIQQVDIDGHVKYTDIRAVRGEGQTSKLIVYPNPSVNGNLNVVFEDNNSLRDVLINDIQGKIIRQYKQVSGNILLIEKLTSGFYTIKVTNRNTAAVSVQKVVVK